MPKKCDSIHRLDSHKSVWKYFALEWICTYQTLAYSNLKLNLNFHTSVFRGHISLSGHGLAGYLYSMICTIWYQRINSKRCTKCDFLSSTAFISMHYIDIDFKMHPSNLKRQPPYTNIYRLILSMNEYEHV